MRDVAGDAFDFRRLREGWQRPLIDEARCLRVPRGRYAWTREVWLGVDGTPQVFARTVVPAPLARGSLAGLTRLGNRPLGDLLFGRRALQRGSMALARLSPADWLHARALTATGVEALDDHFWTRRSVFRFDDRGLLVTEVFLKPWLLTGDAG
jgi:chorismate--pyruvate lyase